MKRGVAVLVAALPIAACVGTTGSGLVSFHAAAGGPPDAIAGQPLVFDSGRGYHVTLTRAKVHVGAVYLNRSVPSSGAQETSCILPGIYVAEVLQGIDVDALSPALTPFPALGDGTADLARAGEVWLTGGDVNAADDTTVVLDVAGTATRGSDSYRFEGQITIGSSWQPPAESPALPGADPICKQRIVTPIPVAIIPRSSGQLVLRIDPRLLFANVNFASLSPSPTDPGLYRFADAPDDAPSRNLYDALHAATGVYSFTWE